jgi:hypothetical protein
MESLFDPAYWEEYSPSVNMEYEFNFFGEFHGAFPTWIIIYHCAMIFFLCVELLSFCEK